MVVTASGDMVENELCLLRCSSLNCTWGPCPVVSELRLFEFAFHGEMKTAVITPPNW